jgi:TolA-binding protein
MALYRIALIYVEQESVDEAVIYLERLTNTYPDSGPAEIAQELLQEIR